MTWNLIGHEWAVQLLQGHIEKNSLRHAYLLTGPPGIGKKNLAIRFIQAITCREGETKNSPCLKCSTCQKVGRLEHPDLFPVRVEKGSTRIKIDQIREIVHSLSLSPYEISRRFGVLLDFETATIPAQNSLLKTLEEPPGKVILVLTAVSPESLLETITSRCEVIKLHPVPISTTCRGLQENHGIPDETALFLAHISGGKPELALHYHQDPSALEHRSSLLDDHQMIMAGNAVERFSYASKMEREPSLAFELIDIWSSLWHDILLQTSHSSAPLQNIDQEEAIKHIARQIDRKTAQAAVNSFRRAYVLLLDNANLKLTIEDLFLQLPRLRA
jgi:DNA polymerase-3 subunit delta'